MEGTAFLQSLIVFSDTVHFGLVEWWLNSSKLFCEKDIVHTVSLLIDRKGCPLTKPTLASGHRYCTE